MSRLFPKMVDKLNRIDQLIRMKATGQPHELASRLEISPSTLYEYIEIMRSVLLAPIRYCHIKRSYVYEKDGKLHIGFKNKQQVNRIG
ncbi:hypothetical protein [Marivirga harenae]|uniref:hypothetical protein n=1 Tax=Marivirga harenae TaxID=2010992 RepID=UPI0026DFA0B4|nr:hypothetical protein [Marivirga harenae]WKV12327.1 hypothetical protein Q3Y49_00550 [Marivirga harenae]